MNSLSIVSIIFGLFVIILRGPLIFFPGAAMTYYRKFFASSGKIRISGIIITILGISMVISAQHPDHIGAVIILILGGLMAFGGIVFFLIFPALFKRFMSFFSDVFEDSADLRLIGVISVLFGACFLYLGVWVF